MSLRPHGHARVNARSPEAFGKCDRCGFLYNLVDLRYQREWAGTKLFNRRLRVCSSCMDKPQPQLRARRLSQDPVPVRDPRPLNNLAVEGGYAAKTGIAGLTVVAPAQDIYAAPAQFDPEFSALDFNQASFQNGYDSAEDQGNLPVSIDPS